MKWIVLILLFTCTFPLFGYIERDCLFLLLDPSCTNQAIGDNGIGVVNPWNDTPSAAYMNPAIAAFHKGVSIEFSNSPWYKDFFDNINYRTGIIDFRFKGITFVIPSFDMHKRFGNDFDYGTQFITNESGEYFGTFNSYENAIITGFAYNPFEIMRNSGNSSPIISHFDLALGLNQIFINSHIAPPVNGLSSSAGHSNSTNLGMLIRYDNQIEKLINCEIVYGLSSFNLFNSTIYHVNESQRDIICDPTNSGAALSISLLSDQFFDFDQYTLIRNIVSFRYLTAIQSMKSMSAVHTDGFEVDFLDTVYIRRGNYHDDIDTSGSTSGFGIKLHYKDIMSFNYNRSKNDADEGVNIYTTDDYNLSFNLMKMIHMFK